MLTSTRSTSARRRFWSALVLIVATLALASHLTLRQLLKADYLEKRFGAALAEASGGLYKIDIGGVEFSLLEGRMTATEVRLYPDSAVMHDTTRNDVAVGLYSVYAPEVAVRGASVRSLLRGQIKASSLRLVRPNLHLALDSRRSRASDTLSAPEEVKVFEGPQLPALSFHERLARQLPRMTIQTLRIDSASFSWERRIGNETVRDSVGSILVHLDGIDTDTASARDTTRVLFSDDARFSVGGYKHLTSDSMYMVSVDSVGGSTKEGRLSIFALNVAPVATDSQLKLMRKYQTSTYRVRAEEISLNAIRIRSIFEHGEIGVGLMNVSRPELDVYLDRALPKRPNKIAATLPHRSLQGVSWNLRLDTIRVGQGRLVYAERAADGVRPGTFRFEELAAEMLDLSNVGDQGGKRASLKLSTKLNGAGKLVAELDYDMSTRGLNLSYRGSISSMEAGVFNETLADLEGIRITRGVIDTAWFAVRISRDSAAGSLQLKYRDLLIAFQDKDTGRRSLFSKLKSWLANALKVKGSNPASDRTPAMVATIGIRRAPEVPLFGFIWVSVRQGLMQTLGL